MFSLMQTDPPPLTDATESGDYDPLIVAVTRLIGGEGTPQEEAALYEQVERDPTVAAIAKQIIRDEALIRVCFARSSGSTKPDRPTPPASVPGVC